LREVLAGAVAGVPRNGFTQVNGRNITNRFEQTAVIEPVDPFERNGSRSRYR
jgi:hypothetical protein